MAPPGFAEMEKMKANRKALVFTESRRTQDYLKNFLESNGYAHVDINVNHPVGNLPQLIKTDLNLVTSKD